MPSTAYAGGLPDVMCYAMAKEARDIHDEALKEFHGYVSMYQERPGTVGASGGTLSTRAAMASGDAWVRKVMTDPFALGGRMKGEREEDSDKVLTKVFRDAAIWSWVAPHVYAFFETRVVRRSNELHRTLVGGPDKGPFYGKDLNVTVYTLMPSERAAKDFKKNGSTSTKAEEERLKKEGKYYGPGEGPPLDDLFAIGVFSLYHAVGVTESGKKICWSIKGRNGYFETARVAVEAALTTSESGVALRSGPESVRGGVLTPGIAGKHVLFDRIRKAGMGFIDWSPGTAWDGKKPEDTLGCDVWGNKATPVPEAE